MLTKEKIGSGTSNVPLMVELAPIEKLKPHPKNPVTHSDDNVKAIMQSIKQFGQRKPLVVWHGYVIAGCGTLEALKRLGKTRASIARCDAMSKANALAYMAMDNKSSDLHEWDSNASKLLLRALDEIGADLSNTGFSDSEVQSLFSVAEAPDAFATKDEDIDVKNCCPKCGYKWS
jgi:ParB-like chromosome segregation protein Spo0J